MNEEIENYINSQFTDFRATIIRFVQTEVTAFLKNEIRNIIDNNTRQVVHDIQRILDRYLNEGKEELSEYIKQASISIDLQKERIKEANKASNDLKQMFAFIKKLNNRISKFHETKM